MLRVLLLFSGLACFHMLSGGLYESEDGTVFLPAHGVFYKQTVHQRASVSAPTVEDTRLSACLVGTVGAFGLASHAVADTMVPSFHLFGLSAAELFPFTNVSLLSWILYIFAPGWEYTKSLALVPLVLNALLYASALFFLLSHPQPDASPVDFGSLEGIVTAFRNPDGVFAGWIHYLVFDPLVGLGEVLDSQEQKIPHFAVVPCLLLTLLFGPIGFLSYLTVRTVTLSLRQANFK